MKRKLLAGAVVLAILATLIAAGLWRILEHRVRGEFFDANGVRIHYTDEGSGEPVVLVHGYAVNADINWRRPGIVRALAKNYRVIALDNRGHGLSDKPHDAKQYGIEMVKDIVRLLDHLGIDKAHVAGYSMGGFITLKLVTMYPDRLLSAAPCAAGWQIPDDKNRAILDRIAESLEKNKGYGPLFSMLEPEGKKPGCAKLAILNFLMEHLNDSQAMAAVMRAFPEFAVTEQELRDNRVPTLSIVGSRDSLRGGVDALRGVMANHEVLYIEGGDHMTTIGRAEFVDGLKAFLAKNAGHGETENVGGSAARRRESRHVRLGAQFCPYVLGPVCSLAGRGGSY